MKIQLHNSLIFSLIMWWLVSPANGQSDPVPPPISAQAHKQLIVLAQDGDSQSQLQLGVLYLKGSGVARDPKESFKWFFLAAEQGQPLAQLKVGMMYHQGLGTSKNNVEAIKWWKKSATQGNKVAPGMLGFAYSMGQGVSHDLLKAEKWYLLAGNNGDSMAQFSLGLLYDRADHQAPMIRRLFNHFAELAPDTPPLANPVKAAKWYELAADAGIPNAQYAFGLMLAEGKYIPQDRVAASVWLNLSFSILPPGQDKDAAYREFMKIKRKMSSDEIRKAKKKARSWRPEIR